MNIFDRASRDDERVQDYLRKHAEDGWPFFVKNLENVQGDERDAIIISTTFGKVEGAAVVRQTYSPRVMATPTPSPFIA